MPSFLLGVRLDFGKSCVISLFPGHWTREIERPFQGCTRVAGGVTENPRLLAYSRRDGFGTWYACIVRSIPLRYLSPRLRSAENPANESQSVMVPMGILGNRDRRACRGRRGRRLLDDEGPVASAPTIWSLGIGGGLPDPFGGSRGRRSGPSASRGNPAGVRPTTACESPMLTP